MNVRIIGAIAIAGIGLIIAGRAHLPWLGGQSTTQIGPLPVPPQVADALAPSMIDTTPTLETMPSVIDRASEILTSRCQRAADAGSTRLHDAPDLIRAFRERLEAALAPDYSRDLKARIARGARLKADEPTPEAIEYMESSTRHTRLAPLGLEYIELRTMYRAGVRVAPDAVDEGFRVQAVVKRGAGRMDIPEDPISAKLDVVEVRLPTSLINVGSNKRSVALVGFQFGWNAKRRQWIPFVNAIYSNPNEIFAGIGL